MRILFIVFACALLVFGNLNEDVGSNLDLLKENCNLECEEISTQYKDIIPANFSCSTVCTFVNELMVSYGTQVNKMLNLMSRACEPNYQLGYQWTMDDILLFGIRNPSVLCDNLAMATLYCKRLTEWALVLDGFSIEELEDSGVLPRHPSPDRCLHERRLVGTEDLRVSIDIVSETKRHAIFTQTSPSDMIYFCPHLNKSFVAPKGIAVQYSNGRMLDFDWYDFESFESWAHIKALNYGIRWKNGMFAISGNGVRETIMESNVKLEMMEASGKTILYNLENRDWKSWQLSPIFVADVLALPSTYSSDTDRQQYHNFYSKYGTHFVESLSMGGAFDLLFTLNAESDKDNVDLEAVLNFLKTVMQGPWALFDINAFFSEWQLKNTVLKVRGGTEFLTHPMLLSFLSYDMVGKFHEDLFQFPAAIDKRLKPLTHILEWLRPNTQPFLEQTFLDYLLAKSSEIDGDELILQASKYEPVFCPEYFHYSHAVDTGSGANHGIFPLKDELRTLCDCCLGTEALNNNGEAECSLYCTRTSNPKDHNTLLLPFPAIMSSRLELPMCYNHSLFNETYHSKYQYGCLKDNLPGSFDCVDLPFSTSFMNVHSIIRYHRGLTAGQETWGVVGLVIAIAFVLTVLAVIIIILVLRWRDKKRAGYKVVSTTEGSSSTTRESDPLVEH